MDRLEIEYVPLDSLSPHPENVREGDVGAIVQSLRVHGQYRSIVAQRSTGYVIAGNHTWRAMRVLRDDPDTRDRDRFVEIAVEFRDVDDDEALRILVVDNRANDLASYDDQGLARLLVKLRDDSDRGLEGTLVEPDDLDALIARNAAPLVFDDPPKLDGSVSHRCPACGHEWTGSHRPDPDSPVAG